MERQDFLGQNDGWWLLRTDIEYAAGQQRDALGVKLGRTDQSWYTEAAKLDQLYDWLVLHDSLMTELDEATDDQRRLAWLTAVNIEFDGASEQPLTPAAPAGRAEPAVAAPAAPDVGKPEPKKGLFARKSPEPGESADSSVPADPLVESLLSSLSSGEIAALADELGVTEEEIKGLTHDPEFAAVLANEISNRDSG